MMEPPVRRILSVRVHDVTLAEALELVEAFIAEGGPHQVCTVNPEFVMHARRNPDFFRVLEGSSLNVPDGVGLLWAGRMLGQPLRERVAGVDLMEALIARAAERGWRVFLLGAAEGVAERAARVLQARYPGWILAGTFAGSPGRRRPRRSGSACRRPGRISSSSHTGPRNRISGSPVTSRRSGSRSPWGSAGPLISSPASCPGPLAGCGRLAWSGSTG